MKAPFVKPAATLLNSYFEPVLGRDIELGCRRQPRGGGCSLALQCPPATLAAALNEPVSAPRRPPCGPRSLHPCQMAPQGLHALTSVPAPILFDRRGLTALFPNSARPSARQAP